MAFYTLGGAEWRYLRICLPLPLTIILPQFGAAREVEALGGPEGASSEPNNATCAKSVGKPQDHQSPIDGVGFHSRYLGLVERSLVLA